MSAGLSFGGWLKRRRRGLGMTQLELGKKTGYSGETIRKVEADVVRPSRQMADVLAEALDIPPEDRARFVRFARDEGAVETLALPSETAYSPPSSSGHPAHNLPIPPTPLIGRKREMARVSDLLSRDDVHLVTLTGPGGTGKTRLALEAASVLSDRFEEGAFFVDLAPIRDSSLVVPTIAHVLDVPLQAGRSHLDTLKDYLRQKHLLLVLDNFEQVVAAAPFLADLLSVSARLKMLVTSREVLNLRGEHDIPVPPLSTPDPESLSSLELLMEYEAVRLFRDRAQAVVANFEVTSQNASAVAGICYRLDGLPLAIELAAARVRVLSPQAMLQRLDSRLALLRAGKRDLSDRQKTLRNTIEWSYDLLNEEEQRQLRGLAVFAGGWTLEAAETICVSDGDASLDVLDGLDSLVSKSLVDVQGNTDGKSRFTMLQVVQEFTLEKLSQDEALQSVVSQRHALFYLNLAERAEPQLHAADQIRWLDQLELEHNNFRQVFDWAIKRRAADIACRLANSLAWFWSIRGHGIEGCGRLKEILSLEPAPVLKAKALHRLGSLDRERGNFAAARAEMEESLTLSREVDDAASAAYALDELAVIARNAGDFSSAVSLYNQALPLFRASGDQWGLTRATRGLATAIYCQGDNAASWELYVASLAEWRSMGDLWGIGLALNDLGEVRRCQGDYEEADRYYAESLAVYRALRMKRNIAILLHNLGYVAEHSGAYEAAQTYIREALSLAWEIGDYQTVALTLLALAGAMQPTDEAERAVRLMAAGATLTAKLGGGLVPADQAEYDQILGRARAELSVEAFERAWAEGEAWTPARAVAYARGQSTEQLEPPHE